MPDFSSSNLAFRQMQMFPTFDPAGIERIKRFGEEISYGPGERIVTAGEPAPGLVLVLSGRISVTDHGRHEGSNVVATHAAGQFMGELAQLSNRPSLLNAEAIEPVDGFVIRPQRLRDLMVQEAELGERIMRALILRRVKLLESGQSGHVIVGQAGHRDVMRLQGFLSRNGQPHQVLDPDTVSCAQVLIERFDVDPHHLPIVLCANGKLLRNPSESEMARCIGLVRPIDTEKLYDVAIVGAGPAGLAAAVYAASEGLSVIVLDSRAFGGQAGASARIENYLGFPTGISGLALMARASNQAQKFGAEMAIPDQAYCLETRDAGPRRYVLRVGEGEGEEVQARAVVIATGVRYRRPEVPDLARFEGSSVHYWASPVELRLCEGSEVALVGGGQFRGPGRRLSGEPGEEAQSAGPGAEPQRQHVALSDRPHRGATQHRHLHPERAHRPARHGGAPGTRDLAMPRWRGRPGHPAGLSVHRRRSEHRMAGAMQSGCRRERLHPHRRHRRRAAAILWRPTCPASSRSAMSAPARSSGLPQRSEKERRSLRPCMPISARLTRKRG